MVFFLGFYLTKKQSHLQKLFFADSLRKRVELDKNCKNNRKLLNFGALPTLKIKNIFRDLFLF